MSTWKTTFVSTLTGLGVVTTTLAAPSLASAQFRDDQVTHTQGQASTDKVDDAMQLVRQAEMEDPAGFARRVAILEQLGDTFRLPHESTLGSTHMDRLAFAATVQDPPVLQGFVEMISRGDIEIIEGTHGAPVWISHLDPEDLTASKELTTHSGEVDDPSRSQECGDHGSLANSHRRVPWSNPGLRRGPWNRPWDLGDPACPVRCRVPHPGLAGSRSPSPVDATHGSPAPGHRCRLDGAPARRLEPVPDHPDRLRGGIGHLHVVGVGGRRGPQPRCDDGIPG